LDELVSELRVFWWWGLDHKVLDSKDVTNPIAAVVTVQWITDLKNQLRYTVIK
jgi:hypothetical protein